MHIPKGTNTLLGIAVALIAFSGFPNSFRLPAIFVLGVTIATVNYYEHRHKKRAPAARRTVARRPKEAMPIAEGAAPAPVDAVEPFESDTREPGA